jgi:hypothetical protein
VAHRSRFSPGAVTRAACCNGGHSIGSDPRTIAIRHVRAVAWLLRALAMARQDDIELSRGSIMGKYFLGWILGVPVIVLVIIYLISN